MRRPLFEVISPGLYTTVQDLGRTGFRQYGMVVSGAMDPFALQVANLLAGNSRAEAALEITVKGPRLRLLSDCLLALAGGDLGCQLDGTPISPWQSFPAHEGQILSFTRPKKGNRAYLSVYGGFDLPPVMGSKSTYAPAQTGGLKGRPLMKGDILYGPQGSSGKVKVARRRLSPQDVPSYSACPVVRFVWGPEKELFTVESLSAFLNGTYQITQEANRMGYRLTGPPLMLKDEVELISSAVTMGTIQIPPNGLPIILMADCQTTGGYPRLGNIISVDLPLLAQLGPGQQLRFQAIDLEKAHRLYRQRALFLHTLSVAASIDK